MDDFGLLGLLARIYRSCATITVFMFLLFLFFATSIASAFINPSFADREWWSGFLQNFSTEVLGAITTLILLELFLGVRKERRTLIGQLRSRDNLTALNALDTIFENGWYYDGRLKKAQLYRINVAGANLRGADLRGVALWEANLGETILSEANLQGANLVQAHLQGAELEGTKLQGANLWKANLIGASLNGAVFDEKTILPDAVNGVDKHWTPGTDMTCYTNSEHPNFWQPPYLKWEYKD